MPDLTVEQLSKIVNQLASENASLRVALMARDLQLAEAAEALAEALGENAPADPEANQE